MNRTEAVHLARTAATVIAIVVAAFAGIDIAGPDAPAIEWQLGGGLALGLTAAAGELTLRIRRRAAANATEPPSGEPAP